MAVPRSRLSNQRKNTRRAHHAKKPRHLQKCSSCGAKKQSHTVCQSCGFYNGRAVFAEKTVSEE